MCVEGESGGERCALVEGEGRIDKGREQGGVRTTEKNEARH